MHPWDKAAQISAPSRGTAPKGSVRIPFPQASRFNWKLDSSLWGCERVTVPNLFSIFSLPQQPLRLPRGGSPVGIHTDTRGTHGESTELEAEAGKGIRWFKVTFSLEPGREPRHLPSYLYSPYKVEKNQGNMNSYLIDAVLPHPAPAP